MKNIFTCSKYIPKAKFTALLPLLVKDLKFFYNAGENKYNVRQRTNKAVLTCENHSPPPFAGFLTYIAKKRAQITKNFRREIHSTVTNKDTCL